MTPHFSDAELRCKCGCGKLPSKSFMVLIEAIRVEFGYPMPVASGARCSAYNQKVSSTGPDGPHTKDAIDIRVSGAKALRLILIALKYGITGIGVSQKGPHDSRFVHLDSLPDAPGQPRPWIWSY